MNLLGTTPILRSISLFFMLILSQLSIAQSDEDVTDKTPAESASVLAESVSEMIALVAPGMQTNSELNAMMLYRIQMLQLQKNSTNLEASEIQLWCKKFNLTAEQVQSFDQISQRFSNLYRGNRR
jgi:hypothetical protein